MKLFGMAESIKDRLSRPDHGDLPASDLIGLIVDDDGLTQQLAHPVKQDPRDDVARAAARELHGVAHATDWMAIIFNPSMPYRVTHMLLASGLTAAFLIAGLFGVASFYAEIGRAHV